MTAAVFQDPLQVGELAKAIELCKIKCSHVPEFRYNKTKDKRKDCFFDCIESVDFNLRSLVINKSEIYSNKLRTDSSALKSFAIRMLLTKNYGQIRDAKIFIDGEDTKAFGIPDRQYLMNIVNRESPGTIRQVQFVDSQNSPGIQLADMSAGAINRGVRTHLPSDTRHLTRIRKRMYQPEGSYWFFRSGRK